MGFFSYTANREIFVLVLFSPFLLPLPVGKLKPADNFFSFFLNKNTIVNLRQGDNIMLKVKNTGKIISAYSSESVCTLMHVSPVP